MKYSLCLLIFLVGCSSETPPSNDTSIESLYLQSCYSCHESGRGGAPRRGDEASWVQRKLKGNATLLAHVKSGYKGMPAMGMCLNCTDEQLVELIIYTSSTLDTKPLNPQENALQDSP